MHTLVTGFIVISQLVFSLQTTKTNQKKDKIQSNVCLCHEFVVNPERNQSSFWTNIPDSFNSLSFSNRNLKALKARTSSSFHLYSKNNQSCITNSFKLQPLLCCCRLVWTTTFTQGYQHVWLSWMNEWMNEVVVYLQTTWARGSVLVPGSEVPGN